MERSIPMGDFNNYVMNPKLNISLLHLTHLNKMVWVKEKTWVSWKWLDVCCTKKSCQRNYGLKLQIPQCICWTECQPELCRKKKTPFEAWFRYKPDLQHLKNFSCICFSHIPQVKGDKLNKKSEPGVFIGYSSPSKAYRISNLKMEKF